jgi:hypothetical protein
MYVFFCVCLKKVEIGWEFRFKESMHTKINVLLKYSFVISGLLANVMFLRRKAIHFGLGRQCNKKTSPHLFHDYQRTSFFFFF